MRTRNTIIAVLLFAICAMASEKMETVYKLTRLSPTEIGIYCKNGGDPAGNKIGKTLIISCGK